MLAKTILTAEELGITEEEHAALIEVRRRIVTGEIPAEGLNMGRSRIDAGCGTIGCIGGWMGVVMGLSQGETRFFVSFKAPYTPLLDLFFRYPNTPNYNDPDVIVRQIDRFLAGKRPWSRR